MLEIRNVSLDIEGEKEILRNVNLTVGDGKLVVLTGPNGGGKSTLAKTIVGLIQPTSGSILLDGEDIAPLTITERAKRGVTFAFQQPVRFKGITVRQLISLAAGRELTQDEVCSVLRDVGLCALDYMDREVDGSLSGGEIKRIEIAMAITRGTKLTIFDEPEAGIDLWSFGNLIDVFKELRQRTKGSLMVISHQERILEIADEIAVLADGKIVLQGPREEVLPQLVGGEARCSFCPRQEKGGKRA